MTEQSIGTLAGSIVNRLAEQTGRAKPFPEQESVMSEVQGDYQQWATALTGEKVYFQEGDPACGFWRVRQSKDDKTFVGVAIWKNDGEVFVRRGHEMVKPERVWPWAAKNPVSEAYYRTWEATGTWPDDHPVGKVVTEQELIDRGNEPDDPVAMLRDQIDSAKAGVSDYAKIQSDEQAAQAQSLRSRLLELSREADRQRESLKRPHFDAAKAVDLTWMPMVKDAKSGADDLAKSMSTYETAKARAVAEAQRRADKERRRREEEARLAAEEGKPAPAPVLDLEPVPTPPPQTQVRGAYGRAAAVRVSNVVTGISDFDALVKHYRPAVEVFLTERAQKDVNSGFTIPGVTVEEQRKVA